MMYRGEVWPVCDKHDEKELADIGVRLLHTTEEDGVYAAEADEEAMRKLDPLWGRFGWIMQPEKP